MSVSEGSAALETFLDKDLEFLELKVCCLSVIKSVTHI